MTIVEKPVEGPINYGLLITDLINGEKNPFDPKLVQAGTMAKSLLAEARRGNLLSEEQKTALDIIGSYVSYDCFLGPENT